MCLHDALLFNFQHLKCYLTFYYAEDVLFLFVFLDTVFEAVWSASESGGLARLEQHLEGAGKSPPTKTLMWRLVQRGRRKNGK